MESLEELSTEDLVRRLMGVTMKVSELVAYADEMKTILRNRAVDTGTREYGPLELKVSANRRFSSSKAKKLLPQKIYNMITEVVPSSKKARKLKEDGIISETEYNALMDVHPHKIGVGFRKEDDV